ncbi:MAG: ABC transporter permease [Cyclobacteriaceae bacterium]|nr:ABC transporter permease [Cyclobacteriaceae bacterium]MCH8516015.1 ABC transporter permease [Cyclobacteriaceae bacterium]
MSNQYSWAFLMARRDLRKNKSKLFLFISAIIVGVGALVAVVAFEESLRATVDDQAKELLGADLVLSSNQFFESPVTDSLAEDRALEVNFASMVSNPASSQSRLTQVRAIEGQFPFYGELESHPPKIKEKTFDQGAQAIILEELLIRQLGLALGDSVKIGELKFELVGRLDQVPGQAGITSTVAPAAYIPYEFLEQTGLIQYGSRVNYAYSYLFTSQERLDDHVETEKNQWQEDNIRYETVESRKASTGRAFGLLSSFLSLIAFIALLLGSLGVASAVNVFIKQKIPQVAVMKCIGVSSRVIISIFIIQIMVMAAFGGLLGILLGCGIQLLLPQLLGAWLPVVPVFLISWKAIVLGMSISLIVSLLFSLLPLIKLRKVSAMMTLRPNMDDVRERKKWGEAILVVAIAAFVYLFSFFLLPNWKVALGFTLFLLVSIGFLLGLAKLVMWLLKRMKVISLPYVIRQGIANLYRPNNQTMIIIATLGLGTAMLSTLYFLQNQLLDNIRLADKDNQPNILFFDIQTEQLAGAKNIMEELDLPIMQEVPIVSMRLREINDIDRTSNREDNIYSPSLFNREFRVTYRDSLISSEEISSGKLRTYEGDSIFVSIDEDYAGRVGLKMGDRLLFNVQGRQIETYIGSMRKVNFNRVSTNFLVLFPEGVLDRAPKFHVLISRTVSVEQSANLQQKMINQYPNISAVDLELIVSSLDEILGQIAYIIQFMVVLSVLTGVLVLISSLLLSRYQRTRESVLLRTLGARWRIVLQINLLEYAFLGMVAALAGLIISIPATWLLATQLLNIPFDFLRADIFVVWLAITLLTLSVGYLNSRTIKNEKPIQVLKS